MTKEKGQGVKLWLGMFHASLKPIEAAIKKEEIQAAVFLLELQELCKKHSISLDGSGDYGIVIGRHTDGKYHEENFIIDSIWQINQDGVDRN